MMTHAKPRCEMFDPAYPDIVDLLRSAANVSQDKWKIEAQKWRYDINRLYEDDKPEYADTLDDAKKHLQEWTDQRRDKHLSASRLCKWAHRLMADNPGAYFNDKGKTRQEMDCLKFLILVRKWAEWSEQEA